VKESVKHRLIGAAVLTAIAVLFLPSFFKDRQQYQVNTDSQIPGRPSITAIDFNEPAQPEGIESAPAPETMFIPENGGAPVAELPVPPAETIDSQPVKNTLASTQAQASSSTSTVALKPDAIPNLPLNDRGLPDAWVIQVASLSSHEGANKLRDQLQAEGHKAYVRAVPSGNGNIYRVFIGPRQDKAQLQAIKVQLDKRLKVNSLVLPFKP
jgi:DedD protein